MNKTALALLTCLLLTTVAVSQKELKPWKQWNRKEAEKVLNDSPWSHSQTETTSSQSAEVTSNFGDTRGREDNARTTAGSPSVTLQVRFFTAKPIRQAYVRMLELADTPPDPANLEKMEAWANLAADDRIIVTLASIGDQRAAGRIAGALRRATAEELKSTVFLERNDGKRVALVEYAAPGKDVFGARLTFPRTVDGQPFLSGDSGSVRFHIEYTPATPDATMQTNSRPGNRPDAYKLKLDMKFKVTDMMYHGELEY
jgi:hypothetical protein